MIAAAKLRSPVTSTGFPAADAWESATPVSFCADWQGHNPDPERQTEARVLWEPATLFVKIAARYRSLYTYPNRDQRQDELWNRDVAEFFLQPAGQTGHNYAEFEISPNGDWLDLKIAGPETLDLNCAMKSRVDVRVPEKLWTAEIAIPMHCLTTSFDPKLPWRVNFFRVEGAEPERFYSSWQPTNSAKPNFHIPEAFAALTFAE